MLKDLPEKIEQTLHVDTSVEQRKVYDARRRFYYETLKRRIAEDGLQASRFFVLEALLELRQVATIPEEKSEGAIVSPKREMLVESVQDAVLKAYQAHRFVQAPGWPNDQLTDGGPSLTLEPRLACRGRHSVL